MSAVLHSDLGGRRRKQIFAFVLALLVFGASPRPAPAQTSALRIVIVEGAGAINNVRQRVAREPVVQVEDENNLPVAGIPVVFSLPAEGPGGFFANNATTFSTVTDAQGRAAGLGFSPNTTSGNFQIQVTATRNGQTTTVSIDQRNTPLGVDADVALVTKYVWRGQRLTNDWSVQPEMTLGIGDFYFGLWGSLDLTAVNEGSIGRLLLPEHPLAPVGAKGLQFRFSEIDYTAAYRRSIKGVSVDTGTILYTFPDRSEIVPWTAEYYAGATFTEAPLTPYAAVYFDFDESRKLEHGGISTYLLFGAGHAVAIDDGILQALELSGTLSFASAGFGYLYYRDRNGGAHDATFTAGFPFVFGEHWSARAFVTYSALLGRFRQHQFLDARKVHTGAAGSPGASADTVWGGFHVNLGF